MRFLRVLCVLALALTFAVSVYAETQSVKVSGDLTVRGIFRDRYNYLDHINESAAPRTGITTSEQTYAMSVAEVEIDADLTDNVQTVIRILNQRDWDVSAKSVNNNTSLATNGRGGYTSNADEFDLMLDLAYVTLKDFIYQPLTLTIGRQDLWFGKGFVVGANQQNPGTNLTAPEYTEINSFDSVKAVLDYDPFTVTGIYAKIFENAVQDTDDVDLWGVNAGYKFNSYKAETEAYLFIKKDNQVDRFAYGKWGNDVYTWGLRGSADPMETLTLAGEAAYQSGQYLGTRNQTANRPRSAWALDFSGECRYFSDKVMWKPKFGAEYIWYSGNDPREVSNPNAASGNYTGWDYMYRGKFDSAIREFVGRFYSSGRYLAQNGTTGNNQVQTFDDASFTNQHQIIVMGSVEPMDSLTLKANWNLFWNQHRFQATEKDSNGWIGSELDLNANWDYTEDVSFGLLAGWFFPGPVYFNDRDQVATDIVGTVKVSF